MVIIRSMTLIKAKETITLPHCLVYHHLAKNTQLKILLAV